MKSIWVSICSGSPACLPLPRCWSLRLSGTSFEQWVCSSPGPHPLCSKHLRQPSQRKEESKANGHAPGVTCAQTQEGRKWEVLTTTPYTSSVFTDGPSVSPRHVGYVEPSRAQALGKDRRGVGAVPVLGRPDSRARRIDGDASNTVLDC